MKYLYTLLSLHLFIPLFAQSHADCALALEICDKQTRIFPLINGAGNDTMELDSATCFDIGVPVTIESNSAWIRWQVAQEGMLWFVITPLNPGDDLDFVVFRLPNGACNQKQIVRCMAAGDLAFPSPCMGATGLLPGETDINAPAGCTPGTNNFLAPLQMITGEQYVLAINNFSSGIDSVRIEFCGTALLGCETSPCMTLGTHSLDKAGFHIDALVPNPVSANTEATLNIQADRSQQVRIDLTDARRKKLKTHFQVLSNGQNRLNLETQGLPAGVYFVIISGDKAMTTRRLVIGL